MGGGEKTRTATIVLRGDTANRHDLERTIDDSVNLIRSLLRDKGAEAMELKLAMRVKVYGGGGQGNKVVSRLGGNMKPPHPLMVPGVA